MTAASTEVLVTILPHPNVVDKVRTAMSWPSIAIRELDARDRTNLSVASEFSNISQLPSKYPAK